MSVSQFYMNEQMGRAYNRGYRDGSLGHDSQDNFEQHQIDKDAYRMGYLLGKKAHETDAVPVIEPEPTPARKMVNEITEEVQQMRAQLLENLMSNPGFLATYGPDFEYEFKPITVETSESRDGDYRQLRLTINHSLIIRDAPDLDKHLKEYALRQDPEGNLESV